MKKILVITPFFYPHIGGTETYMEEMYLYLKKKHSSIQVDVLCYKTNKSASQESYKGLNIYRIPCFKILADQFVLPSPFFLFNFLLKHKKYDLIHTSTRFFDSSWWAPIYAKLTGVRIILTDHCAYYPVTSNKLINIIIKLFEASIVRFSLHFYDAVFAQNEKTKEFLKRNFRVDSTVAYPGFLQNINILKVKTVNKRIKVVYAGRILESKGVKELVEMAKGIKTADFVFAGEGNYLSRLKNKARKLPNVKILGMVSRKQVSKLLYASDIFAYPSWHSEGLPMAIVEAGKSRIAVLATNNGAISELIINNKTGLLVRPEDFASFKEALIRLINNANLRKRLADNLYDYAVKNFSWESAVGLILEQLR